MRDPKLPYAIMRKQGVALQVVRKAASKSILHALLKRETGALPPTVRMHDHAAFDWAAASAPAVHKCRRAVFVRNPFDRLVSCYEFFRSTKVRGPETRALSFAEWAARVCEAPDADIHHRPIATDFLAPAFVGRVETMEDDWRRFAGWLGSEPPPIGRLNTSVRRPYRDYYDAETRRLVARAYAADLDLFGYRF